MKLKAQLSINGQLVASFPMHHDSRDTAKNQFTVRLWIQSLAIDSGDKVDVSLGDDQRELSRLHLVHEARNGKRVLTMHQDTGDRYTWATLTKGYSVTWGFTAGVLLRKKKEGMIEQQGELFIETIIQGHTIATRAK